MDLNDLYKLAGIPRDDAPAIEPQPVEQPVAEQPMDGRDDMKAMIALVTPEQLNQLVGDTPVEEEGFANSGDEYAGEPEAYNGTLGSPADLSLRRYLGANGEHVTVDETKVYEDHKVEDITEAWQAYKLTERPSDQSRRGTTPPDAIGKPGNRGFTPGVQEPETRLKNDRGYDPMGGQEPEDRLKNDRGFDPMGDQVPADRLKGDRGFTPGVQEPELDIGIEPVRPLPTPGNPMDPARDGPPRIDPGDGMDPIRPEPNLTPTPGGGPDRPDRYKTFIQTPGEPVPTSKLGLGGVTPPTPGGGPEKPMDISPKPSEVPFLTPQMRADAEAYADRDGLPLDQLGTLVPGTVGGIPTTLEVDPNSGVVIDTKTGDVIGGDDAEAARGAAKGRSPGLGESDIDENAFNQAAAAAVRAGKDSFEFGGKTHKTTMKKDTAQKLADDIDSLKQLAGLPVAEGGMKQADIEVQEWAEKYNSKTGVNGDELAHGWLQAMLNSGIMSDSYDQDEYIAFNEKYRYEDDMEWEEDDMDKFFAESPITRSMHDEANAIMKKYGIDENNFNDILGHFESNNESINDLRKLAGL